MKMEFLSTNDVIEKGANQKGGNLKLNDGHILLECLYMSQDALHQN